MRLGIGSYTYTWAIGVAGSLPGIPLTPEGLVRRAVELGVQVVQVCDNLPLHQLPEQSLEALSELVNQLGVEIQAGMRGLDPERVRQYSRLAQRFGSSVLRLVIDTADFRPSPEEVVELLGEVTADLERSRVHLAIENHDRFTTREIAQIIERAGSPWIGVCLDTVNSLGALEGPEVVIATLAPFTLNLHIKDFTIGRPGHQMGFVVEGQPAGQGRLEVPWLLRKLRAAGRNPDAILELWTPPEEALADTIAKEQRWAEESVAYLRTLISE